MNPGRPLQTSVLAYTKLLLGGCFLLYICYLVFGGPRAMRLYRSVDVLVPVAPGPAVVSGKVFQRLGVTITWPKVVNSFAEHEMLYDNLLNVIKRWNPDNPDPPAEFTETLQHFNYSSPAERAVAAQFMEAEMPFKLYGVPEFDEASRKWTDEYLIAGLETVHHHVEQAEKNHFMFYHGKGHDVQDWKPPQKSASMSVAEYIALAHKADAEKLSSEAKHYYLQGGVPKYDRNTFVGRDLSLLSTRKNNFFVRDASKNKGIQCRFGMRGVTAASHYDAGRNMVAVLKGRRRYVLNPPSSCEKLSIYTERKHPSFRHSAIDWSSLKEGYASGFAEAQAIDTIIHAGEVLYIPSYWFHYIVSMEYSAQCNSRHGSPEDEFGKYDIDKCFGIDIHAKSIVKEKQV